MKPSLLVEYKDGSFQWIKNTSEEEAKKNPEIIRVKSTSYGNIQMQSRRWKTGKTQFDVVFFGDYSSGEYLTGSVKVK